MVPYNGEDANVNDTDDDDPMSSSRIHVGGSLFLANVQ